MKNELLPVAAPSPAAIASELVPLLLEREREHDRRGEYAAANVADLRRTGLLALTVPSSQGGMGADLGEMVDTIRILATASPSTALMLTMHAAILANYLLDPNQIPGAERAHYEAQRRWAWSEALAGRIFAVANSEPGAAGDLHHSKATVRREADGLLFTGLKTFSSFGTNADYYMAAARNDDDQVDYYLVQNDSSSVTAASSWDALGMRSSESVTLRFETAPALGIFGYRGMVDGPNNRHWSTLAFTALFIGIGESLLDEAHGGIGILGEVETVDLHLTLQAARGFLFQCVESEPSVAGSSYRKLVRDCKTYVTRALARHAAALFAAQTGRAYQFSSAFSRKLRDLLAGTALRPAVSLAFEEIALELRETVTSGE